MENWLQIDTKDAPIGAKLVVNMLNYELDRVADYIVESAHSLVDYHHDSEFARFMTKIGHDLEILEESLQFQESSFWHSEAGHTQVPIGMLGDFEIAIELDELEEPTVKQAVIEYGLIFDEDDLESLIKSAHENSEEYISLIWDTSYSYFYV